MAPPPFSILRCFAALKDPRRKHRRRHLLIDLVAIALCAVIAGANDWQGIEAFGRERLDWLKRFLALPNGIPSHDTFERVFARLSPVAFSRCFQTWAQTLANELGDKHYAIDGKTLCGSAQAKAGLGALQLVSVWATQAHLSLAQTVVAADSNEITAIPPLLELLDLRGALVTIDAMGCQKEIAQKIIAEKGNYVLTVKGNQEHLRDDILSSFIQAEEDGFQGWNYDIYETHDGGHGRQENRTYTVLYDLQGIRDRALWPQLKVIGLCYSERTEGEKISSELRCFIGSKRAKAQYYGRALRDHWRIENNCHWHLDVTFREDASRIQQRHAAANFGQLRKVALSLIQQHPGKGSIAIKRYKAALSVQFLEEILNG